MVTEAQRAHRRAVAIVAVLIVLGIVAIASLVCIIKFGDYQLVHSVKWTALAIVIACTALAVPIMVKYGDEDLFGSTMFCAMCGALAWAFVSFGFIPGANAIFDDSPGQQRRVKVRDYEKHKGSTYKLYVEPWDGSEEVWMFVKKDLIDRKPTHVTVTTHEGAFGLEWISDVKAPL